MRLRNIQLIYIIVFFVLMVELSASAIKEQHIELTEKRVKRGYKESESDLGSPIIVTSHVLEIQKTPTAEIGTHHYEASVQNAWKPSGLSDGYEVWLDTDKGLQNYKPLRVIPDSTVNIGNVGSIFSKDSQTRIQSPLHTQISSGHDFVELSDNVDFQNIENLKNIHYTKSYGR